MGLALFWMKKWQVPWDLPLLSSTNGKSHGTCHYYNEKLSSPMGLAIITMRNWQVPWDLPILNLNDGETSMTCQFHINFQIWATIFHWGMASPYLGAAGQVSGKSHGTCHFWMKKVASPVASPIFKLSLKGLFTMWQLVDDVRRSVEYNVILCQLCYYSNVHCKCQYREYPEYLQLVIAVSTGNTYTGAGNGSFYCKCQYWDCPNWNWWWQFPLQSKLDHCCIQCSAVQYKKPFLFVHHRVQSIV